jgi:hypothetical protein
MFYSSDIVQATWPATIQFRPPGLQQSSSGRLACKQSSSGHLACNNPVQAAWPATIQFRPPGLQQSSSGHLACNNPVSILKNLNT